MLLCQFPAIDYPDHDAMASPGDADYGIVQLAYDAAGRIRRKTDQLGDTCTFAYDLASRLTSKDYRLRVNSPSGTIADTDTYTYDQASRMLTAVSGRYTNTVTRTYDDAGRLEDESLTIGTGMSQRTYTVGREYDSRGQLWKLTYPDTTVVERTYTDRGQLNVVKYGATTIDTRTYDNGGRLSTSTYGNGVVTTYGYRDSGGNKDNQIASIDIVNGMTTIDDLDYSYDANKNVTAETRTGTMANYGWDTDNGGSSGFDKDDRLTYWERDDSNLTQEWALSLVGNWNSLTENSVLTNHVHGDAHELTTVGTDTLAYDAKGNLTTRYDGDDYSWDFDNQLTGADTDGTAGNDVTFEYDALGRRVRKDDGTDDVVYVRAGQQVIAEYAFGAAAGSPTEQYVYGSYIDEPIIKDGTLSSGTGLVYYHHDRRYSVIALTDSSGTAVERYAYSPYGELSVFNGSGSSISGTAYANAITYTGRWWDDETELYYFRARYYDCRVGIFIQRDPLEYVDGLSLYRGYFVPSVIDPTGLCLQDDTQITLSEAPVILDEFDEFPPVVIPEIELLPIAPPFNPDVYGVDDFTPNNLIKGTCKSVLNSKKIRGHPDVKFALECHANIFCKKGCKRGAAGVTFTTPDKGPHCHICLNSNFLDGQPQSAIEAIIIHESIHVKQLINDGRCKCMKTAFQGNRPRIPDFGDGDCEACKSTERPAYLAQARHLYPPHLQNAEAFYEKFVEAGICFSCRKACAEEIEGKECAFPPTPFPIR